MRDPGSHPELVRNRCTDNWLSGMLLFHHAEALLVDNVCADNRHWGIVMTPETRLSPARETLAQTNVLVPNPRGEVHVTDAPLSEIGR